MNMPPRWGFSSFGVVGYKDAAPPELKYRSPVAARIAALIQFASRCRPSRGLLSRFIGTLSRIAAGQVHFAKSIALAQDLQGIGSSTANPSAMSIRRRSSGRSPKVRTGAGAKRLVLGLFLILFSSLGLAQNVSTKDKALLVGLFLRSTDWPAGTFSGPQTPLILGILGQNPFGVHVQGFTTNIVHGRRIEVKTFNTVEDVKECHLLFVGSSEDNNLARIQSALQNLNVLTMGETDEFIRHGGLIKVMGLIQGEKYYFELNKKVYERSRLKIDPGLLEWGKPVAKP